MNNLTHLNKDSKDFISIPILDFVLVTEGFSKYIPIVLTEGQYNQEFQVSVGSSVELPLVDTEEEALDLARDACLKNPQAIGYAVKGIFHE